MTVVEGLVGDIGGTHARFARSDGGSRLREPRTYHSRDYPSAEAAIEAYLGEVDGPRPSVAVLSVAGPVTQGSMTFTNLNWTVSEAGVRREGRFRAVRLINDFAAQALGAPRLGSQGLRRLGPEAEGLRGGTVAVLGPGTGFGVSALAYDAGREVVLSTEGGHMGFAPVDEVEIEIWRRLSRQRGRVSIERVLSGPGLFELYQALADIEGEPAPLAGEIEVQHAAEAGDRLAAETLDRFCAVLGSTAGDIALGLGARGGVFVTGGVAVRLADRIAAGRFRDRFEAKGRFVDYMRAIPTRLILEPYTALIGAASLLGSLESA